MLLPQHQHQQELQSQLDVPNFCHTMIFDAKETLSLSTTSLSDAIDTLFNQCGMLCTLINNFLLDQAALGAPTHAVVCADTLHTIATLICHKLVERTSSLTTITPKSKVEYNYLRTQYFQKLAYLYAAISNIHQCIDLCAQIAANHTTLPTIQALPRIDCSNIHHGNSVNVKTMHQTTTRLPSSPMVFTVRSSRGEVLLTTTRKKTQSLMTQPTKQVSMLKQSQEYHKMAIDAARQLCEDFRAQEVNLFTAPITKHSDVNKKNMSEHLKLAATILQTLNKIFIQHSSDELKAQLVLIQTQIISSIKQMLQKLIKEITNSKTLTQQDKDNIMLDIKITFATTLEHEMACTSGINNAKQIVIELLPIFAI